MPARSRATDALRRLDLVLQRAVPITGVGFVLLYAATAPLRIAYPYEIEWLEGIALSSAARILDGAPFYAAPTPDYVAAMYTPLYYYLGAGIAAIVGVGLPAARTLSLLATLACFALVFAIVRHTTNSRADGCTAAGLLAASFAIGGGWFDLARVDMLFLALLLGALHALQRDSLRAGGVAGTLLALATLTKQTGLPMGLPLVIWALWARPRQGVVFAAVFATLVGVVSLAWNEASGGWYQRFVFDLPSQSYEIVEARVLTYWTQDLARNVPLLLVASGLLLWNEAAAGIRSLRRGERAGRLRQWGRRPGVLLGVAVVGTVISSFPARIHWGGSENVLIPAFALLAIGGVVALGHLRLALAHRIGSPWAGLVVSALLIAQFGLLVYDPRAWIPTTASRRAGERLEQRVAELDGEVDLPFHPSVALRAGKRLHAHGGMALWLMETQDEPLKAVFKKAIYRGYRERRFAGVVCEHRWASTWTPFRRNYVLVGRVFEDPDVFWTLTGLIRRPDGLFVPRSGP